jgi:flagellar assembly protein FliH
MSTDFAFSELRYPTITSAGLEEETERARVRGHAAGYAAGLRAAEADSAADTARARAERAALREDAIAALTAALGALEGAARQLGALQAPVLAEADAALAAAAIELAESIIGRELASAESSARTALARALACVDAEAITGVRLSPVDLAVLQAHDLASPELRFIADPELLPGDAVVEVASGRIDARIRSALDRARAEIGDAS